MKDEWWYDNYQIITHQIKPWEGMFIWCFHIYYHYLSEKISTFLSLLGILFQKPVIWSFSGLCSQITAVFHRVEFQYFTMEMATMVLFALNTRFVYPETISDIVKRSSSNLFWPVFLPSSVQGEAIHIFHLKCFWRLGKSISLPRNRDEIRRKKDRFKKWKVWGIS